MNTKIFCDCDGVLAGFCEGVLKIYGKHEYPTNRQMLWNIFDEWFIDENEFWRSQATVSFWENLPVLENAHKIIEVCNRLVGEQNVCLLTSPGNNPIASAIATEGKRRWINKHFPQFSKNVLFGSEKYFCANKDNILIDDGDHNLEKFEAFGGSIVRINRPWNIGWNKSPLEDFNRIEEIVNQCHSELKMNFSKLR